jgi:opacity protein-like surface antigen
MKYAVAAVCLLLSVPAAAQNPERLPWFALDAHLATIGLPQAEGWVPDLGTTTVYPGRNFGVSGAATVYPFRLGPITFGMGATVAKAARTAETKVVSGSGATQTEVVTQIVRTGVTNFIPQLSLNFGRKLGWSYISAGLGRTKVSSSAEAIGTAPGIVVPEAWNSAINFGGGARWFPKTHIGVGLDIRFVKLGSRSPTAILPSAKRTQQWTISAGISIQ